MAAQVEKHSNTKTLLIVVAVIGFVLINMSVFPRAQSSRWAHPVPLPRPYYMKVQDDKNLDLWASGPIEHARHQNMKNTPLHSLNQTGQHKEKSKGQPVNYIVTTTSASGEDTTIQNTTHIQQLNNSSKEHTTHTYLKPNITKELTPRTGNTSHNDTRHFMLTVVPRGRLGNQMFEYAGLLAIASINKRTPFISPDMNNRVCLVCQTFQITQVKKGLNFTKLNLKNIGEKAYAKYDSKLLSLPEENILLVTFLQSFKYFKDFDAEVKRELQFIPAIDKAANLLLLSVVPSGGNHVTVGIHVRRGDYVGKGRINGGALTPTKSYFEKAMKYFREKYRIVMFLVTSDGKDWPKENIVGDDVVFLKDASPEVHLATLSKCRHMIMSVGTFGWWAGFMTGGDVIYYTPPFREKSSLGNGFSEDDYYPPRWIGMGD